ncbi:uncharacterized protein TNCV_1191721 [Trichonephila clavipes]|nr:uncharacterized protein TNCV_1191721 [Trichonephila clavipes]
MPPNTLRDPTEYVLVKSAGPKVLWAVAAETTSAGCWKIFPSFLVPCLNCGGGDRWCRHLSLKSPTYLKCMATFIPSLREGHDNNNKTSFKYSAQQFEPEDTYPQFKSLSIVLHKTN